jgi:hypothetical protein
MVASDHRTILAACDQDVKPYAMHADGLPVCHTHLRTDATSAAEAGKGHDYGYHAALYPEFSAQANEAGSSVVSLIDVSACLGTYLRTHCPPSVGPPPHTPTPHVNRIWCSTWSRRRRVCWGSWGTPRTPRPLRAWLM